MTLYFKNINFEFIKYITSFTPEESKYLLWERLKFDPNQLKDLRKCIIVEFLRDNIFFCFEKSFSIDLNLKLTELANEMLLKLSDCITLVDLLKFYQQEMLKFSKKADDLMINNLKMHMKYIQLIFFQQFKLYQYIMQHSQDDYNRCLNLRIDQPPLLPPLSDAAEISVHKYAIEIGRLDAEAEEMRQTAETLKKQAEQEKDCGLNFVYSDLLSMPDDCEREAEIKKAINDAATIHLCALSTKLMINITDVKNNLENRIKKKELPKPLSLIEPSIQILTPKEEGKSIKKK